MEGAAGLAAATGVRSAAQWLMVVILSAAGGPDSVGDFSLALAVSSPIFILSELALRNVFVTLRSRYAFATFVRVRMTANAAAGVLALATVALPSGPHFAIMLPLVIAKWMDSLLDMLYASLQRRGAIGRLARWMAINGCLIALAFSSVMFATSSVPAAIIGWALATGFSVLIVSREAFNAERPRDSTAGRLRLGALLRAGASSGAAQALNSFQVYLPVLLLSTWATSAATGVYAAAAYFVTISNLVMSAVQQAMLPDLSRSASEAAGAARLVARRSVILLGLVAVVMAALVGVGGNGFLAFAYGEEFRTNVTVLWLLALSILVLPGVYISSSILLVQNRYGTQVQIAGVALLVTALLGVLLRGRFGVTEGALVAAVGFAVRSGLGLWAARSFYHRRDGASAAL